MKNENEEKDENEYEGCSELLVIPICCLFAVLVALTIKFIMWLFS